jgi:ABC-type sulfate transport system substrate-binding protein
MGSFRVTHRSAIAAGFTSSAATRQATATAATLLNVAYHPIGKLYSEIDTDFIADRQKPANDHMTINGSHGRSAAGRNTSQMALCSIASPPAPGR